MNEENKVVSEEYKEVEKLLDIPSLPWIKDNVILVVRTGSRAYGLNTEDSDRDYKAVVIPPSKYYFGLQTFDEYNNSTNQEVKNTKEDVDISIISISKFVKELVKGSPTLLEMLFVREEDILYCTVEGQALLENRDMFLTKKIYPRFRGFAKSQMKTAYRDYLADNSLGYNHKEVSQAMRLLYTLSDVLYKGEFKTYREDDYERKFLMELKNGFYDVEFVRRTFSENEEIIENLFEITQLRKKPDLEAIESLLEMLIIARLFLLTK